ncbi:MAG: SDR family NAD(P)-dependent oxidoreductase [Cyclobacteriaceae bacterium]
MNSSQKKLLWTIAGILGIALARTLNHQQRKIDLKNKVALVTGGSRGLGLEIARQLVKEGARVAICARDKQELKRAQQDLNEIAANRGGEGVLPIVCDVTDPEQVRSMLGRIKKRWGAVEVLINNAGIIQVAPAEEMERKEYEEAMNIHFWAPLTLMEEVLPEMRKKQEGRIVNISSLAGKVSVPHMAPYTASKHALVGLSESLHAEMQRYNIYITTVCPGLMRTGSVPQMIHKGQHRKEHDFVSLGAAQSLTSMDAHAAAKSIVSACKHGQTSLIMPLQSHVFAAANGLFPGLLADVMGLVTRFLPGPGGIGKKRAKGSESRSDRLPSFLQKNIDEPARRNNERA